MDVPSERQHRPTPHSARDGRRTRRSNDTPPARHRKSASVDTADDPFLLIGGRPRVPVPQGMRSMLVEALEAERGHLARELHDDIGQILIAAKLRVEALALSEGKPEFAERAAGAIELIVEAVHCVRALSLGLRPPMLDNGLVAALSAAIGRVTALASAEIILDLDPEIPRLAPAVELTAYRVVQEAVTNAQRHARARTIHVTMRMVRRSLRMVVQDNGCGFDVQAALERADGGHSMGLPAMCDRIKVLGGFFRVESEYDRGTRIEAHIPIEA